MKSRLKFCGARLAAIVLMTLIGLPALAAAPAPTAASPELLAKAQQEGIVVWYTSIELQTAERVAKAFEAAHPGVKVQVERNGCERLVQRLGQERGSNIKAADVVECSDMTALLDWKKQGWLAAFVPADVAKYAAEDRDPDGFFATDRLTLSPIEYNTRLVKPEDAPKSFADLLDPKWKGKLVKAHPGYSGTILTATYQMSRDLGWEYFEKLAKQRVMQVQSATDTPKKIQLGERAVMVDGAGYLIIRYKEAGDPVEIVYPEEGTPLAAGPSVVFKGAPNPNAARLFQNYMHSREGQQVIVDVARQYSAHAQTVEKPGVRPLRDIKLMKEDPEAIAKEADAIKKRYAQIFRV
jgi:iron(III) transport system substrate-binding protein